MSEIFEEEKSANRRVELQDKHINTDPKFSASLVFNQVLERWNKQKRSTNQDTVEESKLLSQGAENRGQEQGVVSYRSPYYFANLQLHPKSNGGVSSDLSSGRSDSKGSEHSSFHKRMM